MNKVFILIPLLLVGCSSTTTYDEGEKTDEFIKQEATCSKIGGTMVVKRTGTRIRRPIARDELATASCQKKP